MKRMEKKGIVLYDGDCRLCNLSVRFIMKRERKEGFAYHSLHSERAKAILQSEFAEKVPDSIVFVKNGKIYTESDAALRIACSLRFPWSLMAVFLVVPAFIRNPVYRYLAANRHRLL